MYQFQFYKSHIADDSNLIGIVNSLHSSFSGKVSKRVICLVCTCSKEAFDSGKDYDPAINFAPQPDARKIKEGLCE